MDALRFLPFEGDEVGCEVACALFELFLLVFLRLEAEGGDSDFSGLVFEILPEPVSVSRRFSSEETPEVRSVLTSLFISSSKRPLTRSERAGSVSDSR